MVRNLVCGVPKPDIVQRKKYTCIQPAVGKKNPTALPYTCWLLRWWVAMEHLRVVGCYLSP